ncbi:MAG: site-specific integrase [Candidatus Atribacteria bacterium]|nr:site-specific integrase [Candidatus Atribacteria bacterium]
MQIFMNVTVSIYLDKRRVLKDNQYPVKLRITFERKSKLYSLFLNNQKLTCNEDDFNKINSIKPRNEYKQLKSLIDEQIKEVEKLISEIETFSFLEFEKKYRKSNHSTIHELYQSKIEELTKNGQIKTASTYECSLNSLLEFSPELTSLSQVTPKFLKAYESFMTRTKSVSKATIGIYLRNLRSIFNDEINSGNIKKNQYPFKTNENREGFQIPKSEARIIALSDEVLHRFVEFTDLTFEQARAKDYWLFSYLCNGMNPKDMLSLKFSNFSDQDTFSFYRSKTRNTARKPKEILVILHPMAKEIIERRGNYPNPDNYIFPYLENGISDLEQQKRVDNFIWNENKHLSIISEKLGLSKPITFITARHTYAIRMHNENAPTILISGNLGHNSLITTENYIKKIDTDALRYYSGKLL